MCQMELCMDFSPITPCTSCPSGRWYFQDRTGQDDKMPEGQGRGGLNSGIHKIKGSVKKVRPLGKTYLKTLMPKSKTSTNLAYKFMLHEIDGKRPVQTAAF